MNISPLLQKTLSNLTWLSADRMIRLFGAVFVNAWLTRYLGPEQNGILGYALSFAGIFSPIAIFGMDTIVIRDVVREPQNTMEILGSSFFIRLVGALILLVVVAVSILLIRPDDRILQFLIIVLASTFIFQSFDVIDYWYQSQIKSKYSVLSKNIAFFTASSAKIVCLLLEQELYMFVIITAVESVIAAIGLIMIYNMRSGVSLELWKVSRQRIFNMLKDSWPITVTQFALIAQSRIDQVMIGEFLTNTDVGYYAAAQKVAEPLGFLPMVVMSSVYPIIVQTKTWSEGEYYRRIVNLYRFMTLLTILTCIPFALFSDQVINLLYGTEFASSSWILKWIIWARLFGAIGVARSIYISTENLFLHALLSSLAGVMVNVTANYFLIPHHGVYGSIVATYLSGTMTIFAIDAINPSTRKNFAAMMKGILTFPKFNLKG